MTPHLLDAGVWIAARDPEDAYHEQARRIVFDFDRRVAALDLTIYEVANVIGARRGEIPHARHMSQLIVRRCPDSLVRADAAFAGSILDACSEHRLTAYDAAYVAAARRNGWTLVSTDVADLVSKGLAVTPDAAV